MQIETNVIAIETQASVTLGKSSSPLVLFLRNLSEWATANKEMITHTKPTASVVPLPFLNGLDDGILNGEYGCDVHSFELKRK